MMMKYIKYIKKTNKGILLFSLLFSLLGNFYSFAQERITVRSGNHPTYSRVVFDWQRNVTYTATLSSGRLEVNFAAAAIPDFTSMMMSGPRYFSNPSYQSEGGNLKILLTTNNVDRIRHFRSGTKVVVDLLASGAPLPNDNVDASVVGLNATPVAQNNSVAPAEIPAMLTPSVTEEVIASDGNSISGENLVVRARRSLNTFFVDYIWTEDVKAAAFIRANKLWVVFDKYTVANQAEVISRFGERLTSADQLTDLTSTILIYTVAPNQSAKMVRTNDGWQVSLRSNSALPERPIVIGHQSISNVGENIFLMANNLGNVINVEDPYVGDDLAIVTADLSSQGVVGLNNYTEFNILNSAQGIALQLIADDIFVTRHDTGVAVSGQEGLAITRNSIPVVRGEFPLAVGGAQTDAEQMLLDFTKWQAGPLPSEDIIKNRHELLYRLSRATESDRNEARWNLAVYNLAHNNAAEAIGILQLMAESEPAFLENPSYSALLAVSNIKLRRFDKALELLGHKALVAELDAILWRALAHEAVGNYQSAMDDYSLGIDVLSLQTNDDKAAFLFSSIRAASALEDIEYMNSQINGMRNTVLNAKQLTELDYWRGRMAEGIGDEELAAEEYDRVIATGVRYPASLAKVARINQQIRMGEIETNVAIDALEKLRFAWRGDDFELDLLKQLGDLYVEQNNYREGLATLRQAATYFPRSPKTSNLTKEMTDIYNGLFLGGGADNMPPLKAMGLFLEFRELTPLGADGDTMSRNLARRMVTIDLLNDAAELLEYQVANRLQGVARADIASDLAMIYLMDQRPEDALKILRSTRQTQIPDDIELNRQMIETRALVELGQYEEAEVMLFGVDGEVADNLRSDIYWKTDDWNRVVNHGYRLLGNRWTDSAELTNIERQSVLRIAVALALDVDLNGLERLRSQYMDHMENGMFADAFELITAKEQTTGEDIRALTQTIASVDRLETFMDSYRSEFALPSNVN